MISNDKFKQIIKAFFGCAQGEVVPEILGKGATIENKTITAADAIYKAIIDTKWQEFDWDKNIQDFADGLGISFDEMIEALMSLFDELDIYFDVSKHTKEEKV